MMKVLEYSGPAQWIVTTMWLILQSLVITVVHGWIFVPTTTTTKSRGALLQHYHNRGVFQTVSLQYPRAPVVLLAVNNNDDDEEEECFDLCDSDNEHVPVFDVNELSVPLPDASVGRTRLEMQWAAFQNEEACDLEELTTCGSACEACGGRGVVPCRFCGGTTLLSMTLGENHAVAVTCSVCAATPGVESCKACRGSGYVASWTSIMSK